MRVLMLSHLYPNSANPMGGVFVQEQVAALRELGVEITLIAPVAYAPKVLQFKPKWRALAKVPFQVKVEASWAYHPRMFLLPRQLLFRQTGRFYASAVRRALRRLKVKEPQKAFDLIHAHVALPDGEATRRLAQAWQLPYVVTIHGQDFYDTIKHSFAEKAIVSQVLEASAKVIMVSTKLQDIAKREQLPGLDNTVIVPNGVNLNKIFRGQSLLAHEFLGKTLLLSVGNLIPRKAHRVVLQALNVLRGSHPSLHYLIVGDGQERGNLERLTQELGLTQQVSFLGRVDHALALEYMSMCDIFVLPSWDEAFGVVYIEAMAHGKPVLGCFGEGVEDIVTDNVTGKLVAAKNVEDLVVGISSLLEPQRRRTVGEAGRKVVEERFTWEANAKQMLDIYQHLDQERLNGT